jgi:hypothetical protein
MFVPRCPSFVVSRYFRFHHDTFLLLHHDIYVCTAMSFFCYFTIFPISPRCLSFVAPRYLCLYRDAIFLLLHVISDFTTMPIFCCTTIFMIAPRCHLFVASRYFLICTNFFRSNFANTWLCGSASLHSRWSKTRRWNYHQTGFHARLAESAPASVRLKPAIYRDTFCPNWNTAFISSTNLLLTPSNFVFFTNLYSLHDTLFLAAFKMGVKYFRTSTIVYFLPSRFIVCRFTIVYFLPSRFIVCRFTIFYFYRVILSFGASPILYFLPSRLIFRRFTDILFPTEPLIFRRFTIVYFLDENPFPNLYPYFIFCKNFFRLNDTNTVVQRRDISSTVFKIYAAVVPSAATRR